MGITDFIKTNLLKFIRQPEPAKEIPVPVVLDVHSACAKIQEIMSNESNEEWLQVFQEAAAGSDCVGEAEQIIKDLLSREMITVEGYSLEEAAQNIYAIGWGLDELNDLYNDDTVDEITVLPNGNVFVTRFGITKPAGIKLTPEKSQLLLERLIPYDETGNALNFGSPQVELVRRDHTRLTGLCYPVITAHRNGWVLRKHDTINMTVAEIIDRETLDKRIWDIISLLARGRRNIVICGPPMTGKTTLLELVIGEMPEYLSIRVIDRDSEVRLEKLYPERNIMILETHPEVGANYSSLFTTVLRLSPDIYVLPEFRTSEEALLSVNAGSRGRNIITTSHHTTDTVIQNTALLLVDAGISPEMALNMVGNCFHIIIEMFTDPNPERGIKKVTRVTEVVLESNGKITKRTLVAWKPYTSDYLGDGEWEVVNLPSQATLSAMEKYSITPDEVHRTFKRR